MVSRRISRSNVCFHKEVLEGFQKEPLVHSSKKVLDYFQHKFLEDFLIFLKETQGKSWRKSKYDSEINPAHRELLRKKE